MRSQPRLYCRDLLAEGYRIAVDAARSHYLGTVLRLGPGSPVALFNGNDGEWDARLESVGKAGAALRVGTRRRLPGPEPDLWLLAAVIRKQRFEYLVEKATELGVSRLVPVVTRHAGPHGVNLDRLTAQAIEAAEQCERLTIPEVAAPVALDRVLRDWPAGRVLLACAETGAARPIAEVAAEWVGRPAALLVGPEGGFAELELDAARELPFVVSVRLGPRVLRAETAALAALACWQALAGDWRTAAAPPFRS